MFGMGFNDAWFSLGEYIQRNWLVYALGIMFSLPIIPLAEERLPKNIVIILKPMIAGLLLIVSLSGVVAGTMSSFAYFQF
jgi:hypothetical protein